MGIDSILQRHTSTFVYLLIGRTTPCLPYSAPHQLNAPALSGLAFFCPRRKLDAEKFSLCHSLRQPSRLAFFLWPRSSVSVAIRDPTDTGWFIYFSSARRSSVMARNHTHATRPACEGTMPYRVRRLLLAAVVWSDRETTLFRQFIAVLANVGIHPEQFLQNDNGRSRNCLRPRDIGGKRAVMRFYRDVIFHSVLLRRPLS